MLAKARKETEMQLLRLKARRGDAEAGMVLAKQRAKQSAKCNYSAKKNTTREAQTRKARLKRLEEEVRGGAGRERCVCTGGTASGVGSRRAAVPLACDTTALERTQNAHSHTTL